MSLQELKVEWDGIFSEADDSKMTQVLGHLAAVGNAIKKMHEDALHLADGSSNPLAQGGLWQH